MSNGSILNDLRGEIVGKFVSPISNEKVTKENLIAWGMLAALFIYMLVLNILMPLHRDDYEYALIWGTFEKITAWPDVFHSLYIHYLTHGGRMVAFFVLDSFLLVGKEWFNPFNALLFVSLIVLIYWHSQRKITLSLNPYILSLIIVFCWLGLPHFGLVNIWMCGATVYLMTTVFILTFLLPYRFYFLGKPLLSDSHMAALGMFFGGIVAGWTIENTAATMNIIIAGFVFYAYRKRKLARWMVSGFFGSVLGFILLVIAPGNYVRYAGTDTKLIYHFTNLVAASGEMLLYVLPVVLFLVLVWRILLIEYASRKGIPTLKGKADGLGFASSSIVTIGIVFFMLVSFVNGTFFSKWLGNMLYANVVIPLGIGNDHLKVQLFNTLSGLEEMVIYLLTIAQIYRYIFKKLAIRAENIRDIVRKVSVIEILDAYSASYFAIVMIALAVLNNLIMVASPSFPGRATFGSVVFLIIGAVSFFTIPEVHTYLLRNSRKKYLALFVGIIMLPMAAATLQQYMILAQENNERMAYVGKMAGEGATRLELQPLSPKRLILRHVYFVELNNGVSKYGLCRYYGLKDIKISEPQ
jgi:hypothetical protein